MPALSFQKQFGPKILDGSKTFTLRELRKDGRDPKTGQTLFLFTGQRTKQCKKIGEKLCRFAVDKMRMKYGSEPEIAMPFPPAESSPARLPEADAGCCQFLVREGGRQLPCNAPAEKMRQNGFRYCGVHARPCSAI